MDTEACGGGVRVHVAGVHVHGNFGQQESTSTWSQVEPNWAEDSSRKSWHLSWTLKDELVLTR